jgi:hypothetical protein
VKRGGTRERAERQQAADCEPDPAGDQGELDRERAIEEQGRISSMVFRTLHRLLPYSSLSKRRLLTMLIALADLLPSSASAQLSRCERQAYQGVIYEGSSVQQEAAPSSKIPISGARACDRLHPIIIGRSQILPSRPPFTVAYIINLRGTRARHHPQVYRGQRHARARCIPPQRPRTTRAAALPGAAARPRPLRATSSCLAARRRRSLWRTSRLPCARGRKRGPLLPHHRALAGCALARGATTMRLSSRSTSCTC